MNTFTQTFGQALGESLGPVIATIVVSVILFVFLVFVGAILFGGTFLLLALVFYKKRKKKTFLIFGVLSDFFLSFLVAVIFFGAVFKNVGALLVVWLIVFLLGLWLVLRIAKKLAKH